MVMMAALSKAMLTDGRTLDQVIAPDVYAEVKKRAEKAGMPMMAIQRMKPWLVAITLMAPTLQAAGFKPELGIDRHFFDRAKDSGHEAPGARDDGVSARSVRFTVAEAPGRVAEDDDGGSRQGSGRREGHGAGVAVWQRRGDGEDDARPSCRKRRSCISGSSSSGITTGSRTSKRASSRMRAASSSSAPRTSLGPTACRPCSPRRATRSPSSNVSRQASRRRRSDRTRQSARERPGTSPRKSGLNRRDSWHPA